MAKEKSTLDQTVRSVLENAGVGSRFRAKIADHRERNTRTYTEDGRKKTVVPDISPGLVQKFFKQAMQESPGVFSALLEDAEDLLTPPRAE